MSTFIELPEQVQAPKSWLHGLFAPRTGSGLDRWDAAIMVVYAAVLAFAIHYYQPFHDEAQLWMIAHDCSFRELVFRWLHYQGAPALWPLIVKCACEIGIPYLGMNWLGGGFALCGIYVLLRFAPFPRLFRTLLPFTFFLQYQYAAVARQYVLVPLLLFWLCHLFVSKIPKPRLLAFVAGLLANLSLHTAIIAAAFVALYAYELWLQRDSATFLLRRRTLLQAGVIFGTLLTFAAAVSFAAPDISFNTTRKMPANSFLARVVPPEVLPKDAPPLDPLTKLQQKASKRTPQPFSIVRFVVTTIILGVTYGFYGISESNMLALILLLALMRWLWCRGCLRLIIPYFVVILISMQVFVWNHHTGQFFLALVAAVWIALAIPVRAPKVFVMLPWVEQVFAFVSVVVLVLQIGWSVYCIRSTSELPTSPGRETADFLMSHYAGKYVAGFGFETVPAQPYSDHQLFTNQSRRFFVWSVNVNPDRRKYEALLHHPVAVVDPHITAGSQFVLNQWWKLSPVGDLHSDPEISQYWEAHGYHRTHEFCGYEFQRLGIGRTDCIDILEPTNSNMDSHAGPVAVARYDKSKEVSR